jgi:hypothetical protein
VDIFLGIFKDALRRSYLEREVGETLLECAMAPIEGVVDCGRTRYSHAENDQAYQ